MLKPSSKKSIRSISVGKFTEWTWQSGPTANGEHCSDEKCEHEQTAKLRAAKACYKKLINNIQHNNGEQKRARAKKVFFCGNYNWCSTRKALWIRCMLFFGVCVSLRFFLFKSMKVQSISLIVTRAIEISSIEIFNKYIGCERKKTTRQNEQAERANAPLFILLLIMNIIHGNHKILSNISTNIAELITFNERDA